MSAFGFGILTLLTRVVSGPVTAYLVAKHFSVELQGFFFTFIHLVSLQIFAELGLGQVLVQFASHEWAGLSFARRGRLAGDKTARERLLGMGNFAVRWYCLGGLAFAALGSFLGSRFLDNSTPGVHWHGPWIALCMMVGLRLILTPILSILEGCNQVDSVFRCRWAESVLTTITTWTCLARGLELWTLALAQAVGLMWTLVYLMWHWGALLEGLAMTRVSTLSWRKEIWPVQWRVGVTWMSGYLVNSLFTPVAFHFWGPAEAGRVGLTQTLLSSLTSFANLWVNIKAPVFGLLVARRQFALSDKLFRRALGMNFLMGFVGSLIVLGLVTFLQRVQHPVSSRFLPLSDIGLFLIAQVMYCGMYPIMVYMRAFKREPFVLSSLVGGLCIALSTVVLGAFYGARGMAAGYLFLIVVLYFPMNAVIFRRCRRKWTA